MFVQSHKWRADFVPQDYILDSEAKDELSLHTQKFAKLWRRPALLAKGKRGGGGAEYGGRGKRGEGGSGSVGYGGSDEIKRGKGGGGYTTALTEERGKKAAEAEAAEASATASVWVVRIGKLGLSFF
ncbi:hypothetical protein ABFX02_08G096500 [Erythranthe guttata]